MLAQAGAPLPAKRGAHVGRYFAGEDFFLDVVELGADLVRDAVHRVGDLVDDLFKQCGDVLDSIAAFQHARRDATCAQIRRHHLAELMAVAARHDDRPIGGEMRHPLGECLGLVPCRGRDQESCSWVFSRLE